MSVVAHPNATLRKMLEELDGVSAEQLVELLILAFERGLSREPLAELVDRGEARAPSNPSGIRRLIEWCLKARFRPEAEKQSAAPRSVERQLGDPEEAAQADFMARIDAMARDLEARVVRVANHPYGIFLPAHEVDLPIWVEVFGESDPARTIASYLPLFFRPADEGSEVTVVYISEVDTRVIGWIMNAYAERLSTRTRDTEAVRACLIAASKLHRVIEGGLQPDDKSLFHLHTVMPEWLGDALVEFWATEAEFEGLDEDEDIRDRAVEQAEFAGRWLLGRLSGEGSSSKWLSYVSDERLMAIFWQIRLVQAQTGALDRLLELKERS